MFIVKLIPSSILSRQAQKPTGIIGRYLMTKIFNKGNAALNSFVKESLNLQKSDHVLEIGFGPGTLISEIAEITTEGIVEGVDFSKEMYKQANDLNHHKISTGKVRLHKVECSSLPFGNESFSKICSTNTIYFWDEPEVYFKEFFRVAKRGATIAIGFRDKDQMSNLDLDEKIFNNYSQNEVVTLLLNSGFSKARIVKKEASPFVSYCALGEKA